MIGYPKDAICPCGQHFTATSQWHWLCPYCISFEAEIRADNRRRAEARFDEMTQQAVRAIARQNLAKGKPCGWH